MQVRENKNVALDIISLQQYLLVSLLYYTVQSSRQLQNCSKSGIGKNTAD